MCRRREVASILSAQHWLTYRGVLRGHCFTVALRNVDRWRYGRAGKLDAIDCERRLHMRLVDRHVGIGVGIGMVVGGRATPLLIAELAA